MVNLNVFIRNNINLVAIVIYITLFSVLIVSKPNFLYNKDGTLREFGIGTRKKTVFPVWLVAILLSILSYFFVLYYLALPKLY